MDLFEQVLLFFISTLATHKIASIAYTGIIGHSTMVMAACLDTGIGNRWLCWRTSCD